MGGMRSRQIRCRSTGLEENGNVGVLAMLARPYHESVTQRPLSIVSATHNARRPAPFPARALERPTLDPSVRDHGTWRHWPGEVPLRSTMSFTVSPGARITYAADVMTAFDPGRESM